MKCLMSKYDPYTLMSKYDPYTLAFRATVAMKCLMSKYDPYTLGFFSCIP